MSDEDEELIYAINSAVNVLFFFAMVLSSLLLCVLYVIALLLAKDIKWKM